MKRLSIAILTTLLSISSFAQTIGKVEKALPNEKQILCKSVERQLEIEQADAAVDMKKCLKGKFTSRLITEGIVEIKGVVPLNSPGRKFSLSCAVAYDASKKDGKNLIAPPSCK